MKRSNRTCCTFFCFVREEQCGKSGIYQEENENGQVNTNMSVGCLGNNKTIGMVDLDVRCVCVCVCVCVCE